MKNAILFLLLLAVFVLTFGGFLVGFMAYQPPRVVYHWKNLNEVQG